MVRADDENRYGLEFDKDYETKSLRTGKATKKHGLYFAGFIAYKDYVGFYFMPIYAFPKEFSGISPSVLKLLKGKSCFHIRKLDPELIEELEKMT